MVNRLLVFIFCGFTLLGGVAQKKGKKNSSNKSTEDLALKAEATLIEAEKQLILENYSKAYQLFLTADELNPNSAAVQYKISEVLIKNGENNKALYYAEKARKLDPSNKYYFILNAEIYKSLGNYEGASRIYEEMIEKIPGTEQYLYDLASIYQFQGKYANSLRTLERVEEHFGISEGLVRAKQNIHLKTNSIDALVADWDKLIQSNPNEERLIVEFAGILISNGWIDQAEEKLKSLRETKPGIPRVDLLFSEVKRIKGSKAVALELLKEPITSPEITISEKVRILGGYLTYLPDSTLEDSLVEVAEVFANQYENEYQAQAFAGDLLYQVGEKKKAVSRYLSAIEISPGNFSVWQNILNLEAQANQFDSVIVHSEKALEYFPNQAIFYFFNGVGNYVEKNYKRSTQILEAGKKYTSDKILLGQFYGQLGDAYNGLQDHAKSDQAYEKALEQSPTNDHVLNNYSYFLSLRREKLDKAMEMSRKLIELHPENPTYLDTHGWVLYVSGEYKEAKKYLKKAVSLGEDGTVLEHYGDVLFKLGEMDEALIYWEKASKTDEASEFIFKKISDRKIYE